MTRVVAVIPARLASSRLPRKVLLAETGKTLIQHVWEGARKAKRIDEILIATDSVEVADVCCGFGATPVMTSEACACGTDRVAEAAAKVAGADLVLNVQGDEPEMDGTALDALVAGMLKAGRSVDMGTVATPWPDEIPLATSGCVKVVTDAHGHALYFSRSIIPHVRDDAAKRAAMTALSGTAGHVGPRRPLYRRHIGIYAYWRDFLLEFAAWPPSPLELAESLEQLRALEAGRKILVVPVSYTGAEVNTPEDYAAFVEREKARWKA
jgi:3-deoxy-manno-octulosonate cytidylyltransferase (CMP-KDO synthetase)